MPDPLQSKIKFQVVTSSTGFPSACRTETMHLEDRGRVAFTPLPPIFVGDSFKVLAAYRTNIFPAKLTSRSGLSLLRGNRLLAADDRSGIVAPGLQLRSLTGPSPAPFGNQLLSSASRPGRINVRLPVLWVLPRNLSASSLRRSPLGFVSPQDQSTQCDFL